jgi:hypothetical protein
MNRRLRGQKASKRELLQEDQASFLELPPPFEACRKIDTRVDKLSLVRFDRNDYSVPVRYAYWNVTVKGSVDRVRVCDKDRVLAEHDREWDKEKIVFNPLHYLELLERKPGALDEAKPLAEWHLPGCFHELRSRLEAEDPRWGTREFIGVLRLLEKHSFARVEQAIEKALQLRHCHRDVVAQYLYEEEPVTAFSLEGREHLKGVYVAPPNLNGYRELMGGTQ